MIGEEPEDVNPAQARLLRSDREAEVATRTAATAVETYGVEMGGTYAGIDLASLQEIDPTIPATVEFRSKAGGYSVTVPSKASGNRFTVEKRAGALEYICSSPGKGDCPKDGDWAP